MALNNKAEGEADGEIASDLQYVPRAMGRMRQCVGAKRAGNKGGGRKWKNRQ